LPFPLVLLLLLLLPLCPWRLRWLLPRRNSLLLLLLSLWLDVECDAGVADPPHVVAVTSRLLPLSSRGQRQ
jgi:hypothetical protein